MSDILKKILARKAILSGAAMAKLEQFVATTRRLAGA